VVALAALLLLPSVIETHSVSIADLPVSRITGVARSGEKWLVGGLNGFFVGRPDGTWKQGSKQAVKTVFARVQDTWILYGNGGLDKVDLTNDRLYFDVLKDVAKRPWVASLSPDGSSLLLGGQGGWIERRAGGVTETYPPELKGRPVTAMAHNGPDLWIGTQDGLYRWHAKNLQRYGFGAGMPDVWVTSLVPSSDHLVVAGLAAGGLVLVADGKVEVVSAPSKRIRSLLRWNGHLVLGALDGAWERDGEKWNRLTDGEATCLCVVGSELAIGTSSGLRFFRDR
jgi:ligand-binding sensor domain-containing protein